MLKSEDIRKFEIWIDEHRIEDIECMTMDMSGGARGKSMPPEKFLKSVTSDGLRLPDVVSL